MSPNSQQLFAIGQSIAVSIEAGHGYGSASSPLDGPQAVANLKVILIYVHWIVLRLSCSQSEYAASLLYVASLSFAKASVLALIRTLTPIQSHRRAAYALASIILLWCIIGILGTTFLCHLPRPWNYLDGQCADGSLRVG